MLKSERKHFDILSWALGFLMLVLLFFILFHIFSFSEASHRVFSKRVQKTILQADDALQHNKAELLKNFDYTRFKNTGIYVFKDDTLVFWNKNSIEPKTLRKRVPINTDTIVNLNVGDYLVTSAAHEHYSFYLFKLLNTTYPVENRFFVNRFQPLLGNHKISFGMDETDRGEVYPVYSRSGKLLSCYSIDVPTRFGSSNLSFLIICVSLFLLVTTLLVVRLVDKKRHRTTDKTTTVPKSKRGLLWFILVFLAITVLVWLVSSRLFQYGFSQGFFIPNAIKIDYFFLVLFVFALVLVAFVFLLRKLSLHWLGVRNELLLMIGQLVFWGVLLTFVYDHEYTRFENHQIQQVAQDLSLERDLDFEQSYLHFLEETQRDTTFNAMIRSDDVMEEVVVDYIRYLLLDSVMNQYSFALTICSTNQELVVQPYDFVTDCNEFFQEKTKANHSVDLGNGLFFIDDNTLDPNYLSVLSPVVPDTVKPRTVYLEFSKPIIPQGFGMSKLLHDDQGDLLLKSSVACYRDSLLIYKYGPYIYPTYLSDYQHPVNEFSYGLKTKHYVYQADDGKVLAICYERKGWREMTTPFVLFFFLLLVLYLLIFFVGRERRGKSIPALSRRFQIVVLVALSISFLVVGPVSVFYLKNLYTQKINETNFDRTRTLSIDITNEVDFSFLKQPDSKEELDNILRHYSETFFTDINVYDVDGRLLATTCPELTESQIQSSVMNAEAFHNMQGDKSLYYIHEETLGNAVYQSSYISIQDDTGKALAYLNIPYISGQSDLHSEIVHYVLTYINIVLLITFIFLPLILIITRRMTAPLVRLQERMRLIDINKSNEQLEWKSNDEIGALINQYNQLVVELEKSAAELKRTTAESAWRGVARQVAHEIKNSLTPMRLSVQMLQRTASNEQDEEVKDRVQRTTATLLEQIDALSDIASSFSQYAKLPVNNPQPLDLAELVGNLVNLYDNEENIKFSYEFDPKVDHTFNGDKTNLNSAIGNIIKNAVQAVATRTEGRIAVALRATESTFVISVKDNGKGIKEEDKKMIFLPNFTTKSGGSGVGLSLAYNVIQSAGGAITFESEERVGTEFVITLPK